MGDCCRVLVTGGAGFVGSHLVDRLLTEGFDVTALDDFSRGQIQNLSACKKTDNFHLVRGDVRDIGLVERIVKDVDAVFHEAAMIDVPLSIENPHLFNDVNVVGTLNLLKACLDSCVRRFVFASSAAVYGDSQPAKKNEKMILKPASPYAVSKMAAENYVRVFNELHGLETVTLRYFNVYGPRQRFSSSYGGVIITFISRLIKGKPPIIYGDGAQTRDFVHVHDVVSANILALHSKKAVGATLNIASGEATTIRDLAGILQRITKSEGLNPVYKEQKAGDIRHSVGDISEAEDLLCFRPKIELNHGLSKLVEWYNSLSRVGKHSQSKADSAL